MSTPIRGSVPRPAIQPQVPASPDDATQAPISPPQADGAPVPAADEFTRVQGDAGFGRLMGPPTGGSLAADQAVVGAPRYQASVDAGGPSTVEISPETVVGPPGSFEATSAAVAARFASVDKLGQELAAGTGPLTDEQRAAWNDGQAALRREVTELAAAVAKLPPNAPERNLAQARLTAMSERLAALELPVLARLDPQLGESWAHFHSKAPGSEGSALGARLDHYGISEKDLETYVLTGKEPKGMSQALADARKRGEWPGLGVVRAAYQMRADYLRATAAPDDAAAHALAKQLDDSAAALSKNRAAIHMQWGAETFFKLTDKYPDESKRTPRVKAQIEEARQAIASVRSRAVEQVLANPARYGKNSPTRKLAADALRTEAGMLSAEATKAMARESQELAKATDAHNKTLAAKEPKVVPPPPQLHPDLAVGGAVDLKRDQAVTVDPRLKDVVAGGDRAVAFAREVRQTQKLRLGIDEQQVAHLTSKNPGEKPPAELVGRVHKQLDTLFRSTLETHDKLTREKPGTLSLEQTRLLAELDNDAAGEARKIAQARHQRSQADTTLDLARSNDQFVYRGQAAIEGAAQDLEKSKLARVKSDLQLRIARDPKAILELSELDENPAAYAAAQPDNAGEAAFRKKLAEAGADAAKLREGSKQALAKAEGDVAWNDKVIELGGLHTDAEMAAGLAKDAIGRSEAHLKAIPAKGPERLGRLQAAVDHQQAVLGVNTLVRDNADARIGRTMANHQAVQISQAGVAVGLGDDPVDRSAQFVAKVTAEETAVKRGAFQEAKDAAMTADALRKQVGEELDAGQAKLGKSARERQAPAVQQYKDALAVQQSRMHGSVAGMGADLEPMQAQLHLDRASEIVQTELPYEQVSRIDDQQAAVQHARNMARGDALAGIGEASLAVAERAQTMGGVEYGQLVVDSLGTASRSAGALDETLTIDAGGAGERTADKEKVAELRARRVAITEGALAIDNSADVEKLADVLEQELVEDVDAYNKSKSELEKAIREQRGEAFGFFMNGISRLKGAIGLEGGDLNAMSVEDGLAYLNLATRGKLDAMDVQGLADDLRAMKRAGVPGHVLMAAIRDPRLANLQQYGEKFDQDAMDTFKGWRGELLGKLQERYGTSFDPGILAGVYGIRANNPLGRVLETARSNRTDDLVAFVKNDSTDLLAGGRAELGEMMGMANAKWAEIAPYAAFSQVVDQVVIAMVSQAALAGAFARVASATKIPQLFNAARGATAGMSTAGRLTTLAGINAAEAGLGMVTGAALGKTGELIFGKGSTGAKLFEMAGGGLQLSVGSKVALQSGLAFQAGLGLVMGGAPIVAQELGMDPALAEKLGTAAGIFIPTVLGTIGNHKTIKRAEGVMTELGVDPVKAKTLMGEVFQAESQGGAFDVQGFVRERAGKLVGERFPELPADARTTIADTMTLDAVRKRVDLQPPARGTAGQHVKEVEAYYGRLEAELVKEGIKPDRARTLVLAEKTAMYDEALAHTNGALAGNPVLGNTADPNTSTGTAAATRQSVDQLAHGAAEPLPEVQVLHTERSADGRPGQRAEEGLRLLHLDRGTNTAVVLRPDGSFGEVPANNVVFVHQKQALGLPTAAAKHQLDLRLQKMSEPERQQWSQLMGEAHQKSPEHAQLLRKLLAGGAELDDIKGWHEWAQTIPQHQLGAFVTPGKLQQHLLASCSAAGAQVIESILFPQAGMRLKDPRAQAAEQIQVLARNRGAAALRDDAHYDHRNAPPLPAGTFVPAKPLAEKPPQLDGTLTLANQGDFHVHDTASLDRRRLPAQLAEAAGEGPVYLQGKRPGGEDLVYEVVGTRQGQNGAELLVRNADGSGGEAWWNAADLAPRADGTIRLDGDAVLTHVAVPPDRPLPAAERGMSFDRDPQILNMIRAATGKNITRHAVEGDAALAAIHRSVQDVGFAGVGVGWRQETTTARGNTGDEPLHQLVVVGARKTDAGYSFDVHDPTTGAVRTLTGDQLLSYHDGVSFDRSGQPIQGALRFVQIPDDIPVGQWPVAPEPPRSGAEAAARHLISEQEPHKLATLKAIDRLPDGEQRRVATLLLRSEKNLDRLAYLEDAVKGGPEATRQAITDLADPSFAPTGRTAQDPVMARLATTRDAADADAVLSDLSAYRELDGDSRLAVAELFANSVSPTAQRALLELLPTLGRLPQPALEHALQRLAAMMPDDLAKVARRHHNLEAPDWRIATGDDGMRYARQVFGSDQGDLAVAAGGPRVGGGKVIRGSSTALPLRASLEKVDARAKALATAKARAPRDLAPNGMIVPRPDQMPPQTTILAGSPRTTVQLGRGDQVQGAASRGGGTVDALHGGGRAGGHPVRQFHLFGDKLDLAASQRGYQVYVLYDRKGEILYVGRAGEERRGTRADDPSVGSQPVNDWEDRLREHVSHLGKQEWVGQIDRVEVMSDLDFQQHVALEHDLIAQHKPQGNLIDGTADRQLEHTDVATQIRHIGGTHHRFWIDVVP
jgi:hypothetical protein